MAYNVEQALKDGVPEEEIARHLSKTRNYRLDDAIKAGVPYREIIDYLAPQKSAVAKPIPKEIAPKPVIEKPSISPIQERPPMAITPPGLINPDLMKPVERPKLSPVVPEPPHEIKEPIAPPSIDLSGFPKELIPSHEPVKPTLAPIVAEPPKDFGLRPGGAPKGTGFLGVLPRPDGGVSTEISVGVNIDGQEVEIPSLVPTLDPAEKEYLLSTPLSTEMWKTPMGQQIMAKAVEHAKGRMAQGKSPFAQEEEQPISDAERAEQVSLAEQAKANAPQIGMPTGKPERRALEPVMQALGISKEGTSPIERAKASNLIALSEATGGKISPSQIEPVYEEVMERIGFKQYPTPMELYPKLGIAAGILLSGGGSLALGVVRTVLGIAGFLGTKEAESLATQVLAGEKPKLLQGREVKEFLGPLKEPYAAGAEVGELFLPVPVAGKIAWSARNWFRKQPSVKQGEILKLLEDKMKHGQTPSDIAKEWKDPNVIEAQWKDVAKRPPKGKEVIEPLKPPSAGPPGLAPSPEPIGSTIPPTGTPPLQPKRVSKPKPPIETPEPTGTTIPVGISPIVPQAKPIEAPAPTAPIPQMMGMGQEMPAPAPEERPSPTEAESLAGVRALRENTDRLIQAGGYEVAKQQPKSKIGEQALLKRGYKPLIWDETTGELALNPLGIWVKEPAKPVQGVISTTPEPQIGPEEAKLQAPSPPTISEEVPKGYFPAEQWWENTPQEREETWQELYRYYETQEENARPELERLQKEYKSLKGKGSGILKEAVKEKIDALRATYKNIIAIGEGNYVDENIKHKEAVEAEARKAGISEDDFEDFITDYDLATSTERPYYEQNYNKTNRQIFNELVDEYRILPPSEPQVEARGEEPLKRGLPYEEWSKDPALVEDVRVAATKAGVKPEDLEYLGVQSFKPASTDAFHIWNVMNPESPLYKSTVAGPKFQEEPMLPVPGEEVSKEALLEATKEEAEPLNIPEGWTTAVQSTWRRTPGWQAEVDWKDKRIVFETEADSKNVDIVNHEIGHIQLEDKLRDVEKLSDSPLLQMYAKIVGEEKDTHINFIREHLAMDYGNYLTDSEKVKPELKTLFEKYFPKEEVGAVPPTAQHLELMPEEYPNIEATAMKQDGKVYKDRTHINILLENNLDPEKAIPGFVTKQGKFVEQYPKPKTEGEKPIEELKALGYDDKQIERMKPDVVAGIVDAQTPASEVSITQEGEVVKVGKGKAEDWSTFTPNEYGYESRDLPGLKEGYFIAQQAQNRFDIIESKGGSTKALVTKVEKGKWKFQPEVPEIGRGFEQFKPTEKTFTTPQEAALEFNRYKDVIDRPEAVRLEEYKEFGKPETHRHAVINAVNRGESPEGLKDYPDLEVTPLKAVPQKKGPYVWKNENRVLMAVKDDQGRLIDRIDITYDGTEADAVRAANEATRLVEERYGNEWSNIQSQTGATDNEGKAKWIISPNRQHIAEISTDEARYILGDISARPAKAEVTPIAPTLPPGVGAADIKPKPSKKTTPTVEGKGNTPLVGEYLPSGKQEFGETFSSDRVFGRDLRGFAKELQKDLGWEEDPKHKLSSINIAPIGGDGTILMWKPNSEFGLYVSVPVQRMENDSLKVGGTGIPHGEILWRWTTKKNPWTGLENQWLKKDVTPKELADLVRSQDAQVTGKQAEKITPEVQEGKKVVAVPTPLPPGIAPVVPEWIGRAPGKGEAGKLPPGYPEITSAEDYWNKTPDEIKAEEDLVDEYKDLYKKERQEIIDRYVKEYERADTPEKKKFYNDLLDRYRKEETGIKTFHGTPTEPFEKEQEKFLELAGAKARERGLAQDYIPEFKEAVDEVIGNEGSKKIGGQVDDIIQAYLKDQEPVETAPREKELPTMAIQHSLNQMLRAIENILVPRKGTGMPSGMIKKAIENSYAALKVHGPKVGIEIPPAGTFFSLDKYRKIAGDIQVAIGQKYGSHPTEEMRAKREAAKIEPEPVKESQVDEFPTEKMIQEARDAHEAALGEEVTDEAWDEIQEAYTSEQWAESFPEEYAAYVKRHPKTEKPWEMTPEQYKTSRLGPANDVEVLKAARRGERVNALAVDTYNLGGSLPTGFTREGDFFVPPKPEVSYADEMKRRADEQYAGWAGKPPKEYPDLTVTGQMKPVPGRPAATYVVHRAKPVLGDTRTYKVNIRSDEGGFASVDGKGNTPEEAYAGALSNYDKMMAKRVAPITPPGTVPVSTTLKQAPPGGWTEADMVPEEYRKPTPPGMTKTEEKPPNVALGRPPATGNRWFVNDQTGKMELYFAKEDFNKLPDGIRKDIKGRFLWAPSKKAWVSKAYKDLYWPRQIVGRLEKEGVFPKKVEEKTPNEKMIETSQKLREGTMPGQPGEAEVGKAYFDLGVKHAQTGQKYTPPIVGEEQYKKGFESVRTGPRVKGVGEKKGKYRIAVPGEGRVPVEAEPIKLKGLDKYEFFVHKSYLEPDTWDVSESSSGFSMAKGDTKEAAIAEAESIPKEKVEKALDQTYKGISTFKPATELTDEEFEKIVASAPQGMGQRNADLGAFQSDPRFYVNLKPGEVGYQKSLPPENQPVRTDFELVREYLKTGKLSPEGKAIDDAAKRLRQIMPSYIGILPSVKTAYQVLRIVETGEYNGSLHPDNKGARKLFEELTGRELPRSVKATKDFFTGTPFKMYSVEIAPPGGYEPTIPEGAGPVEKPIVPAPTVPPGMGVASSPKVEQPIPQVTPPGMAPAAIPAEKTPWAKTVYGQNYNKLSKLFEKWNLGRPEDFRGYQKLKAKEFMDLNVEYLTEDENGNPILALSHNYEQEGDLVPDPDMEVRILKDGAIEALTFQDYRSHTEVYPEPGKVDQRAKKDLNSFLGTWLKNIGEQGHAVEVPEKVAPTPQKGFAAEMLVGNEWGKNALVFATEEEAANYGNELMSRWMGAKETRVAPVDKAPNYTFKDWELKEIPKAPERVAPTAEIPAEIQEAIDKGAQDAWVGNLIKERAVKAIINKFIADPKEVERIFELVKQAKMDEAAEKPPLTLESLQNALKVARGDARSQIEGAIRSFESGDIEGARLLAKRAQAVTGTDLGFGSILETPRAGGFRAQTSRVAFGNKLRDVGVADAIVGGQEVTFKVMSDDQGFYLRTESEGDRFDFPEHFDDRAAVIREGLDVAWPTESKKKEVKPVTEEPNIDWDAVMHVKDIASGAARAGLVQALTNAEKDNWGEALRHLEEAQVVLMDTNPELAARLRGIVYEGTQPTKGAMLPNGYTVGQAVTFEYKGTPYEGFVIPSQSITHVAIGDADGNQIANIGTDRVAPVEGHVEEPNIDWEMVTNIRDTISLKDPKTRTIVSSAKSLLTMALGMAGRGEWAEALGRLRDAENILKKHQHTLAGALGDLIDKGTEPTKPLTKAEKGSIAKLKGKEGEGYAGEISEPSTDTAKVEDDRVRAPGEGTENVRAPEGKWTAEDLRGGQGPESSGQLRGSGNKGASSFAETEGLPGEPTEPERGHKKGVGRGHGDVAGVQRRRRGLDHRITPADLVREGSWRNQAKTNLDIIELVKKLEAENRQATPEEQKLLAKYTGWGASELANKMFPAYTTRGEVIPSWADNDWKPLAERLVNLLTPEEIKTAANSTQFAHYTSAPVIRSIYRALERFGFAGGKILEPGMGVGHFFGLLPDSMRNPSVYTGIEYDKSTASIAKYLYPNQNVLYADFTKQKLPNDFFDLAIGNPPFSSTKILVDPDYKKYRFNLHEYFFAKSLDKVRPGGILTFITSRYTMDKGDDKARAYLMDRADLLGAIRLPQTAFKENAGTEVVTDVLFFRKKIPDEETTGKRWFELSEVQTPEGPFQINEYFADHPEMILGKNSGQGSMYGKNEYTVLPLDGNIEEHFANAVENLPENVYSIARQAPEVQKKAIVERDFNPTNKKEGGLYLSDKGEIMIVESGSGVPLQTAKDIGEYGRSWLKGYLGIRDAVKRSHYDQLNDGPWEVSLEELQKKYREFVKANGRINQYTVYEGKEIDEDGNEIKVERRRYKYGHLFKNDIEFPLVTSLEVETETGDIIDGPALSGRTLKKPSPREIRTAPDALAVSLDTIGKLDLEHIGGLLNKPANVIVEQLGDLVYKDPSKDAHVLADEYLSGDVVAKLEEARVAAETDPQYQRNVEALIKAQPLPLTPMQVTVNLGAPWVPPEIITNFAHEILGLPQKTEVIYNPTDNSWEIGTSAQETYGYYGRKRRGGQKALKKQQLRGATSEWGTPDRGPNEILESVLNNKTIKVTRTDSDKKTYVDVTATAAANDVAKKMRARFKNWVWEDTGRTKELLDLWNSTKNNIAPRKFDGSHLTTPGVTLSWKWHDHQKRAIWRIIQAGNTYINHAVGAGKTAAYIAAGMEMKRMGLINKPIYAVPRSVLQQFANEFQELYPMANIMVADEENFHTDNRRRFIAQATLNNPDAIVVTHSALGLLRMREENIAPVRDAVLGELRDALADLEEEDAGRIRIKQMEKRIDKAEQRFDSMIQKGDNVVTFEDMGADFIFVDEAHLFRKLDFTTNRQAKGIDPVGSQRAMDLYIKTKWLESEKPGRSHVFGSGTPVTNTIGELYTVMRYFTEPEMEKEGIRHFDAWANIFGEVRTDPEMNAAGRYEMVERFSKFVNVPEMMARVRTFMDVVTMSQLAGLVSRPPVRGGAAEIVITPSSDALKKYQREELQPRIEASRAWKPSKEEPGNPDPLINIITDGRLASIDMRFVRSVPNDPNSKLNKWIDEIIEGYKETSGNDYLDENGKPSIVKGAAQICFYNLGFGSAVAQRRGFDARAWVTKRFKEAGIPLREVAWFDDYNQPGKKDAKNAMVKELRNGTKRILIGSAKTMGVGLNVQRRLAQEHYLDPPWYPADVEQPDGRILRQGNQNKEVTMKRYATKGSYDGTQWQMVARKSKAIEDAFLGENVRELEDISESSQYEMASALASGDERAIRVAGLKGDIENLRNLQSAHYSSQRELEYNKSSNESAIKYQRKRIGELQEAEKKVPEYVSDITGKVGNKTYTDKKEFGEAIIQVYKDQVAKAEEGRKSEKIGEINGIPLFFRVWGKGKVGSLDYHEALNLRITDDVGYDIEEDRLWIADTALSPGGLVRKLVNKLNGLSSETSKHESNLREYEDNQKKVLARLGIPFPMAQELNQKVSELAQLEGELLGESAAATAAEAAQRKAEGKQTHADVIREAREALQKKRDRKIAEGKGPSEGEAEEEAGPETGKGPPLYSVIPLALPFLMGRGEKDKKRIYPLRSETPSYLPPGLGR